MTRNQFLSTLGAGAIMSNATNVLANSPQSSADITLPVLAYAYNALEPHIDAMTMEIHHSKHHQAYVTNFNKAMLDGKVQPITFIEMIKNISKYSAAIRNNGGGHWNHSFFWEILSPKKTTPSAKLLAMITKDFGSLEKLQTEFNTAATSRFGSGWAWLITQNGKLKVSSTPNQDNPLMDVAEVKGTPILALDVWEHAYYLKYQNKRADYAKAFWNLVNWEQVEKNLNNAK